MVIRSSDPTLWSRLSERFRLEPQPTSEKGVSGIIVPMTDADDLVSDVDIKISQTITPTGGEQTFITVPIGEEWDIYAIAWVSTGTSTLSELLLAGGSAGASLSILAGAATIAGRTGILGQPTRIREAWVINGIGTAGTGGINIKVLVRVFKIG